MAKSLANTKEYDKYLAIENCDFLIDFRTLETLQDGFCGGSCQNTCNDCGF